MKMGRSNVALAAGAHYEFICIMQADQRWLQMVSGGEQGRLSQSKKRARWQETNKGLRLEHRDEALG